MQILTSRLTEIKNAYFLDWRKKQNNNNKKK